MSTVLDETLLENRPEIDLSVLTASPRTEPDQPVVLALDIGTSGVRSSLFNHRGNEIAGSQTSLTNDNYDLANGADVDAHALVEFTLRGIDLAVARAEKFVSRIQYVAASCFWHSLMGIDNEGHATTPLYGWADTRAMQGVTELRSKFYEQEVHQRTGARFHPSYWPAKLLWLKQERPELFKRTHHWISFCDYLFLSLFGELRTGVSMASATGLFNQHNCEWDRELVGGLDLSTDQLPTIAGAGQAFLTEESALRWPLLESAVWFPAVGDGAANNIGAGCVDPGRAALMIGTSGALRVLYHGAPPVNLPSELFCYRADRNRVVIGGALSDGGGLYRWMKESLRLDYEDDDLESELGSMQPDAHGLTVLPFWFGERATGWAGSAQGSITGLTARTTPADILRAMMEAVCYRFALLSRALEIIAPGAQVVAAGNALQSSRMWTQMLADVLGRRIEVSAIVEASTRGAALLALEATGKIDSIEKFDFESAPIVYDPDGQRHLLYAAAIERQEQLYRTLIG